MDFQQPSRPITVSSAADKDIPLLQFMVRLFAASSSFGYAVLHGMTVSWSEIATTVRFVMPKSPFDLIVALLCTHHSNRYCPLIAPVHPRQIVREEIKAAGILR
jgi:hypothetical protein